MNESISFSIVPLENVCLVRVNCINDTQHIIISFYCNKLYKKIRKKKIETTPGGQIRKFFNHLICNIQSCEPNGLLQIKIPG